VYKLFTRDLGLLYVHAQGVREVRNRNRFALRTHAHTQVTLVRGRGTWRLTGARAVSSAHTPHWRRVLALAGGLLALEDPAPRAYALLATGESVAPTLPIDAEAYVTYEAILALFLLHELGYVARPRSSLVDELLAQEGDLTALVERLMPRRRELVLAVNATLEGLPGRRESYQCKNQNAK
jgi:hypothetical protein